MRTIAVFTGNRAEYGLQYPILRAIAAHPDLDYRLIVSGAHLDPHFGRTLEEIERDGFTVHAEVKIDMEADTLYATAQAHQALHQWHESSSSGWKTPSGSQLSMSAKSNRTLPFDRQKERICSLRW